MSSRQKKYNPFEDPTIHITKAAENVDFEQLSGREGFNDVLKHADTVTGVQTPKKLEQYPHQLRSFYRLGIIISLLVFFVFLIYGFIRNLIDTFE